MNKRFDTYILDISSNMRSSIDLSSTLSGPDIKQETTDIHSEKNHTTNTTTTSINLAKQFIQNDLSDKMIRNLKTNYSQLILSTFIPDSNKSCLTYGNSDSETCEKSAGTVVINEDPISPPTFDFLKHIGSIQLDDLSLYNFPSQKVDYPRFYVNIIKSIERMNNFIKKKKFPFREIHLFSGFDDVKDSQEMDHPLKDAIIDQLEKNDIILKIYDVSNSNGNLSSSSASENKQIIMQHFQSLQSQLPNNIAIYSLKDFCSLLSTPKLRNVSSVRILSQYQLRFFSNPARNTLIAILNKKIALLKSQKSKLTDELNNSKNVDVDEKLDELQARLDALISATNSSTNNSFEFCIEVDGFKAIKQDHPMSQSLFHKDVLAADGTKKITDYNIMSSRTNVVYIKKSPEKIEKIKQEKIRRIQNMKTESDIDIVSKQEKENEIAKDDEDIDFYDVKPLNSDQCQPTFKYANRYLPVSADLYNKMEYVSLQGFDFRGIMKLKDLPPWYLMTEPIFLFPTKNLDSSNPSYYSLDHLTIFNSLVCSVLEMESVVIARYCKNNSYIRMVALIPVIVRDSDDVTFGSIRSLGGDDPNRIYAFIMNELPFKEDEKTMSGGSFTKLDVVYGEDGELITEDSKYLPDEKIKDAMDDYVKSMDMDSQDEHVDGNSINLSEFSNEFLASGYTNHNVDMKLDIDALSVDEKLLQLLPSAHITTYYLRKVAIEAANHDETPNKFLEESGNDLLSQKGNENKDPVSERFFNNFKRNSQVDRRLMGKSKDKLEALKEILDVKAIDTSLTGDKSNIRGSKFNIDKSDNTRRSKYRRYADNNDRDNSDSEIEEVNLDEDLDLDDILGL